MQKSDARALEEVFEISQKISASKNNDDLNFASSLIKSNLGNNSIGTLITRIKDNEVVGYHASDSSMNDYNKAYISEKLYTVDRFRIAAEKDIFPRFYGTKQYRASIERDEEKLYSLLDSFRFSSGIILNIKKEDYKYCFATTFPNINDIEGINKPLASIKIQMFATAWIHAISNINSKEIYFPSPLTPRESECLLWAAKGKTAWEISKILSISEATVIFHIENSKKKLQCNTLPQATATAVLRKYIEI